MYSNIEELKEAIEICDLEKFEKQILNLTKPAIQILREKADEDSIPIGGSKLGGNPDLPEDFEWQYYEGRPLTFMGQFKLSELHPYDEENLLPDTGILYYFYDADTAPWGEVEHKGGWQVYYIEDENTPLVRTTHPRAEGINDVIDSLSVHRVSYTSVLTLPLIYDWEFEDKGFAGITDDESDNYWELVLESGIEPAHQVAGYEVAIQGDVREYVVRGVQNIPEKHDPVTNLLDPEQLRYVQAESKKWQFLFQIDSDDDLDIIWGDAGRLYICIPKTDLQERNFDECWTIMQCH